MRKILFFWIALLGFISNGNAQAKIYIDRYLPICDTLSRQFAIPANVIIGVAMIESGNGEGRVAKLLNNHFGIVGPNNLRKTHRIKTRYRQYESDTASFSSFCRLVSSKRYYPTLKGDSNEYLWLQAIGSAGYCRNPRSWAVTIINQLKKYGLMSASTIPPPNWGKVAYKKNKKHKRGLHLKHHKKQAKKRHKKRKANRRRR